jgi:membrane protein
VTRARSSDAPPSKLERARIRTAALQARAEAVAERAQAGRGDHAALDATFELVERDVEVGGGIIAGALAYRFFLWLLPFGLVLVSGLGLAADATSKSLAGLVSSSIASAAKSSTRWYALLVGVPVLFLATRSVLRVLIGSHRLVWTDVRAAAPRPTATATARLLLLICGFFVVSALAGAARAASVGAGVVVSLAVVVPYTAFWLLVSIRLPHRDADWRSLVPGALLFGAGVVVLQLVAVYVIAPLSLSKEGTYGALGIAASLLIGLFMISRLMVAAAAVNATLWERSVRGRRA